MDDQVNVVVGLIAADNEIGNNLVVNNVIPAVAAAVELGVLNQGNDDLFNIRGERPPRNERYFEETIPLYSLSQFKSHFRMSRQTMEGLIQEVGQILQNEHHIVPLDKKVMFSVWLLAHPETFLAAGDRFNLSKGSSHYILSQITSAICGLNDHHISWPTPARQNDLARIFEVQSNGFPGIIGAMDSTHIRIKQPTDNANDYYNRNKYHSVNLFAVCDDNCRFLYIATGYPGRLHDARVYRISDLGRSLANDHRHFIPNDNHHIIADCAYPLLPYVMTPYQDNGHLNNREVNYNYKLSSVRSVIERAFGRLKGKFRKLNLVEQTDLLLTSQMIVASCVVHNIIIDNEGLSDEEYSDDEDENNIRYRHYGNVNRVGNLKRRHITDILP